MKSEPVEYSFTDDNQPDTRKYIQLKNVSLYKYSSQENNGDAAAANMIDGNINTGWHNTWAGEKDKYYSVEFDKPRYITSIEYKPSGHNGILKNVDIYTSMDGVNWEKSGEVRDLNNDYNLKVLNLNKPTEAKFVKLQAINTYGYPNDVFFTGRMLNFFEDTTK
ncbi:discoidin domain-containing protein, partial [Clostridium perfringens]